MKKEKIISKTEEISSWWNDHPFAFGVSNTQEGRIDTILLKVMNMVFLYEKPID